jgi:hypothetical protein
LGIPSAYERSLRPLPAQSITHFRLGYLNHCFVISTLLRSSGYLCFLPCRRLARFLRNFITLNGRGDSGQIRWVAGPLPQCLAVGAKAIRSYGSDLHKFAHHPLGNPKGISMAAKSWVFRLPTLYTHLAILAIPSRRGTGMGRSKNCLALSCDAYACFTSLRGGR